MTATIFTISNAAQALAERAAPLLRAHDDMVFHSDHLAGLFDRTDTSEAAVHCRDVRRLLSDASAHIETALLDLRHSIAMQHQVAPEQMPSVAWLIKNGERA